MPSSLSRLLSERRRRNRYNDVLGLATVRLRRELEATLSEDPDVQRRSTRSSRAASTLRAPRPPWSSGTTEPSDGSVARSAPTDVRWGSETGPD
jgi:hypothetical protein